MVARASRWRKRCCWLRGRVLGAAAATLLVAGPIGPMLESEPRLQRLCSGPHTRHRAVRCGGRVRL
eukprot:2839614-Prymnesium_polylepis.1